MQIDIITLFPGMFHSPFSESIVKRAIEHNLVDLRIHNLRDWGQGKHKVVDDYPFGGGHGMVMKPESWFEAVESVTGGCDSDPLPIILLTPQGRVFNQMIAAELSENERLIFLCGHYEGIDERVRKHLATHEISIGDYILTGGELAAMVVVDSVIRYIPGVLGAEDGVKEDSHAIGLLEYPQYTRPQVYRDWPVPDVLLSGNHALIAKWRRQQSILRTFERRPDLLEKFQLSSEEKEWIAQEAQKEVE